MRMFALLITSFLATLATSGPVYAYLDPNTGSILLQILLGGFAGLALAIKLFWGNFLSMFRFGNRRSGGEESGKEE